ncbi:MAG: hypothetical protein ACI8PZ_003016 [Myxococcota bacterium]|jgi:hypothetical protein
MFAPRLAVLGALLVSPAAFAATLSLGAGCPGPVDISVTGTPGGSYLIVAADSLGSTTVPSGACRGAEIGIEGSPSVFGPFRDADRDGVFALSPTVPLSACRKQLVAIDLETCESSRPTTFPGDIAPNPECSAYADMTDAFRNVDWEYDYARCDNALPAQWYRMGGDAGSMMLDWAPGDFACGTHASGWIDGHPAGVGDTTSQLVCYDWSGPAGDCTWSHEIEVTNCGPFYVYNMIPTPWGCSGVYCGQ